jgi:DNA-binding MarR family transcriptional regulator
MAHAEKSARQPRFVYLLAVAHRRVQSAVAQEGEGFTAARAGLLLAMSPDKSTPMSVVGPLLDLAPPALSNLVERAVRAKLVVRKADEEDGRAWNLSLTASGRAARKIAVERARSLNARLCEGFSDQELSIIARWLTAVRDQFPTTNEEESA